MRVALVTSARLPEAHWRDVDADPLTAALTAEGVLADHVPWDGEAPVDWSVYDVLVVQSPWSMWLRMGEFADWLSAREADGSRLLNPADVVRLGSTKRYLAGLAAAGVATVPTTFFEPGATAADLRAGIRAAFAPPPRPTVVIKPVSSGGALGIGEFAADGLDAAVAHARSVLGAGLAVLVQPYIAAIDTHRELAVVVLDGKISHAITKAAILRPGTVERAFHPDPRPYEMSARQQAVALSAYESFLALRTTSGPPVYSVRLDFLITPDAEPGLLLLEVEAVAPVKFLSLVPERVPAFARVLGSTTG